MTTPVPVGDVCRLAVYGPDRRVELAVPVHVPIADLLPPLLMHLDQRLATTGLEHGGWVLQRLGEAPLDEDLGTAALGLCDGDVVYLRPRDEQLPPIAFDDVVDGVAAAIAERRDRWRPAYGVHLAFACAGVFGVLGMALALRVDTGSVLARLAGVVASVLLCASTAAVKAFDDRRSASVLAILGVGYSGLAGLAVPALNDPVTLATATAAPALLAAGTSVAVASLSARFATGTHAWAWTAVSLGAGLAAAVALTERATGWTAAGAAAIAVPALLVIGYFAPVVVTSSVGIPVPPLPTKLDQFQENLAPEPSAALLRRAATADQYVTAVFGALGAVLSVCLWVIAVKGGDAATALVWLVALVLLLHCRELVSAWQRIAAIVPAAVGILVPVMRFVTNLPNAQLTVAVAILVALVALGCVAGHVLPERRLIPHWGLAGDIAHWLAAIAIVPLALQIVGLYSAIRTAW